MTAITTPPPAGRSPEEQQPATAPGRPLDGLSVVEVAVGVTDLGLGPAGGLPGMLLADLGAAVTRVVAATGPELDRGVEWGRVWHRAKTIVATDDADRVRSLLLTADVALAYGPEDLVEGRGLGYADLAPEAPSLVHARCRPSRTAGGAVADHALLVEARSGFCSQLAGHRPGPILVDVRAPGSGAAFLLTASVLGLLHRRARGGGGGWAETSLYDGLLATLGCMIGRSERAATEIESYWEHGSTYPNFLYPCADGELIQVWFGGKGMYDRLIGVLGDEPSEQGYYRDQATGGLRERAERWHALFAERTRDEWITALRAAGVAAEPVLGPGEALGDPHLAEIGLAIVDGPDVVVGSPIEIRPLLDDAAPTGPPDAAAGPRPGPADDQPPTTSDDTGAGASSRRADGHPSTTSDDTGQVPGREDLLAGLRVVDFSAFVAGPLTGQILADLGAEVIKVEPPQGEAMRGAAYAIAACQRGKRSLAIDLGAPGARPVIDALLRSADVVLHNFRVGVAERLGIDESTVATLNPGAVHLHASAFGDRGPRAAMPGNDALMQALTGFERANGGEGNAPIAATWIPIDMTGGWVGAIASLAGLYARAVSGRGQRAVTSLLGAGMLLHSGVFLRHGEVVRGPALDGDQTGYGPGYRLYRCGDGSWLALVVPDAACWVALRGLAGDDLPERYVPLRDGTPEAERAEAVLTGLFATAPARRWLTELGGTGLLAEPVAEPTRDGFRRGVLDDPVNRQLGRVVTYRTGDWGRFEQIGPLLRYGPATATGPVLGLPGVGEHSARVLADLGFDREHARTLATAGVITDPAQTQAAP